MRLAVVGSGAAGLMTAWLLQENHDVVVYEAAARLGGHAHTVTVPVGDREVPVEIGAEFFFEEGYGGLLAILDRLDIPRVRDSLTVSMTIDEGQTSFMVPPVSPAGVRSVLSPRIVGDLLWMQRMAAAAEKVADRRDWSMSVADLLVAAKIPSSAADRVIVPLIASSWGVERATALNMAAYSVVSVMGLRLRHRPHTCRLQRGLSSYIERVAADCPRVEFRLGSPVEGLTRRDGQTLVSANGTTEEFDAVVLACDWHNSARLCAKAPALEAWHRAFSAFEDYETVVAVHTDTSYMPANRKLWGAANFYLTTQERPRTTVWSGRVTGTDVFRTWLRDGEEPPASTVATGTYRHIVLTTATPSRQAALARLQGEHGVYAAGMYTDGVDNHESAIRSALLAAERIDANAGRVRWFAPLVSR